MGDVSRRRGLLQGQDDSPSGKIINAMVPLGEMFGYATSLRSMSQGRATFTMEFDHYAEAPSNIADAVIKKGPDPTKFLKETRQWQRVSSSAPSRT
jgi:elongation factor G